MDPRINLGLGLIHGAVHLVQSYKQNKKVLNTQRLQSIQNIANTAFNILQLVSDYKQGGATQHNNTFQPSAFNKFFMPEKSSEAGRPSPDLFKRLQALHAEVEATDDPAVKKRLKKKIKAIYTLITEEDDDEEVEKQKE